MGRLLGSTVFLCLIAGLPAAAFSQDELADCLFAGAGGAVPRDCQPDPYNIGQDEFVRRAIQAVGLRHDQVLLRGCSRGSFATSPAGGTDQRYNVSYPLRAGYQPGDYAGAIAHELGHVSQLAQRGSIAELRRALQEDSSRVELGADFLAGVLFRRHMRNPDQGLFEHRLELIGNYRSGSLASHSSSEARTSAFRTGFYLASAEPNLARLSDRFQRDQFAIIVREIAP